MEKVTILVFEMEWLLLEDVILANIDDDYWLAIMAPMGLL